MPISMNTESSSNNIEQGNQTEPVRKATNWSLTLVSCLMLATGNIGGPLLIRLYYLHGGKRKWLGASLQTVGFPFLLLPLTCILLRSSKRGIPLWSMLMEPKLFIMSGLIGVLVGLSGFSYSLGIAYLPVSSSSILLSTQLAFTALFAWLIVKQKFTPFSINSVILMTLGSVLLGIRSNGDRPVGVSHAHYLLGFFLTLASATLIGLEWPCIEFSYSKSRKQVNYCMVLQFQISLAVVATIFSFVGMLVSKDFQAMKGEAKEFGLGHGMYYTLLFFTAVAWQLSFLGSLGLIFYTSSLFNGIVTTVLLPLVEVASVIAYHESFNGEKGISLALCVWGFISYFYGEYRTTKKVEHGVQEQENKASSST